MFKFTGEKRKLVFWYDENGDIIIDPNSAVGILESFKEKYPEVEYIISGQERIKIDNCIGELYITNPQEEILKKNSFFYNHQLRA